MIKKLFLSILSLVFLATTSDQILAQRKVKLSFDKTQFANPNDYKLAKKAASKGLIHFKKDKPREYSKATTYFEEAYKYAPDNASLNYYLGTAYLYSYNKKKCLPYLEKAYKLNPQISGDILFKLARGYHLNYEFAKAREYYSKYKAVLNNKELLEFTPILTKLIEETEYGEKYKSKPERVFIDNLGTKINSDQSEFAPVITVDGKTLFFTARRDMLGKKKAKIYKPTGAPMEKVFMSRKEKGEWNEPILLPKPVNDPKNNTAVIGISQDSRAILLFDGKDKNGDIAQTQMKTAQKWEKPHKKYFGRINTKYRESSASIHFSGKIMYFTSNNPKYTRGGSDIYESRRPDVNSKWGAPINLGNVVNSIYSEESVFISPDGQTLYFSSNRQGSMGGYDIFKCEVQKDGTWSPPINLGYPINTPDDDMFFSINANGRFGFYASTGHEDNQGEWDIYMITFLGPEKPLLQSSEDVLIASIAKPITETVIEKTVEIKTIRLTIVKGKILDSFNEQPVNANIEVVDVDKNEVVQTTQTNSETGEYTITLPSGRNYAMMVSAQDYMHHSENFNIPATTGYQEITKNIMLNKLAIGAKVVLNNIFFDFGKTTLHPSSYPELERVVTMLNAYKTLVIEIGGHTDNVGSAASNKKLSEQRAKAVVDYLVSRGIPQNRLQYKGYGFEQPIADNSTEEGRATNRRVEFKIIKK